jgi:hypothetical protein
MTSNNYGYSNNHYTNTNIKFNVLDKDKNTYNSKISDVPLVNNTKKKLFPSYTILPNNMSLNKVFIDEYTQNNIDMYKKNGETINIIQNKNMFNIDNNKIIFEHIEF